MLSLFSLSILLLSFSPSAIASVLDVSAGTDSVIYNPGDNVTITGMVRNAVTKQPITSASVTLSVTKSSTTIHSDVYSTDSNGKFTSDPFTVSSTGTHTFTASASKLGSSGGVTGYFDVESEKRYTLTTDQYTYSPGDNATITLEVLEMPDQTGASGEGLALKIKRPNGTLLQQETLTTDSDGQASTTFTIPGYGEFVAVIGNGLAMAVFEAPSFQMKVSILGSDGKKKSMFSNSDTLKVKTTAKVESSTGVVSPVKNVDITVNIKDVSGNTIHTFSSANETSDGVYETGYYSLSSLTNGEYYADVRAEKGSSVMTSKAFFNIKSLRIELIPIGEMEGVVSFLRGKDVRLGIFAMNLDTGDTLSENAIYGATIVSCRDMKGKSCISKIAGSLNTTEEGFKDFSKILRFTAPNETGEYFIEVDVNTSAGIGRGGTHVFVQNVIAFAETMDSFGGWRWRYGPGENVTLRLNAYSGSYSAPETINSIQILEIRNDSWDDILSSVITNSSLRTTSGDQISFSAPESSGWYNIKLKVNTSGGVAYTGAHFEVQLYDMWVDLMDGPYVNNSWRWKFGSGDDVYFHFNVFDLGGHGDDNRINSSLYSLDVTGLRYDLTGKTLSNINVTDYGDIADDSWERPVIMLNLSGLNLPSGEYAAQIELTDLDGNKGHFEAWFRITNLNVWTMTTGNAGLQSKWRFEPTENITIKVNGQYFNGTNLPDGTEISILDLMYAQKGPPMPVPTDVWQSTSSVLSGGTGLVKIKAKSGKSLSQGQYMALVNVSLADGTGTEETEEAWFEVSAMDAYGWAQPSYVSTGQNASLMVTATKTDGTAINTTMQLVELRDTMSWTDVMSRLTNPPTSKSSSSTTANFNFSTSGLSNGQYEAVIRVTSQELGAKSEVYVWFGIQNYAISGEFVDNSKRVYAPEEDVEMYITVKYPNGTAMGGQSVNVYQLVNTESWPWSFVDATMVGTASATDQYSGKTRVTFKAPRTSGRYRAMVNVSGELQTDPWLLPDFEVRSADVRVTLKDSSGNIKENFKAGGRIQAQVDVSNPTGGTVTLNSISLRCKNLDTQDETTLQTVTTNLGSSNLLNFTAPTEMGDYVLFVSVSDNATGNVIIEKRWFKVKTFDVKFWMDQWSVSPGANATINIDARNPDGTAATVTLKLLELRDMWTWSNASGYTLNESPKTISGSGSYGIPAPGQMGEYEATLCVYNASDGCLSSSQRLYMGFSVQSFEIYTWPMQGSYTTDDTVVLVVEVNDGGMKSASNFNVSFLELRDTKTWADASSLIDTPSQANEGTMKKLSFSAENLNTGEYSMRVNVTYNGESRMREIWFRVSDFQLTVDTVPSTMYFSRKFFVDQNITFNISVSPAPSSETQGKLRINDDMRWIELENYDITIGDTGFTTQTLSLGSSGYYTAIAEVGNAQEFFWFEVGAYDIGINHDMGTHELGVNDNVTVVFNLTYPNGTEYSGDVNVSVRRIVNTWDWSTIAGTQNINSTAISASLGAYEYYTFPPGDIGSGQYEAEVEFVVDGKVSTEYVWFQIRTKMFDAWTTYGPYSPGDNVTIQAVLRYPNGTAWSGVNISVEEVWSKNLMQPVEVTYVTQSADTDSNGEVNSLMFTIPNNLTGKVDVQLKENVSDEIRWLGFDVNTYEMYLYRTNNKWVYLPGETFEADLYVSESGSPGEEINITVRAKKEGMSWAPGNLVVNSNPGITDSNGYININFTVPNETSHYEVLIEAGYGAAFVYEGFDVATFFVDTWVDGNISGSDKVSEGELVTATVYVKSPGGSMISGANVSIIECRRVPQWTVVPCTINKNNQTTDSTGRAEVKFTAPSVSSGEFVVRLNITANISGVDSQVVRDAWFKISEYSYQLEFQCPPGAPSNCNPNLVPPGGQLFATLDVTGNISFANVCLQKVKNMWNNMETQYGMCFQDNVSFTVPSEMGDYDAVFKVYVYTSGNETPPDTNDEWRWFKVEGSSSGMMMDTWVEPKSVWAGTNATAYITVWDNSWQPMDLDGCMVTVMEIRNSMTWDIVYSGTDIAQWPQGVIQDGMGPDGAFMTIFGVNSSINYGDYEAKVRVECGNVTLDNFMHFQVPAFQVSSLMKENVKSNETLYFWFRVTDKQGNPITGTVYKDKLIDEKTWNAIENYNEQLSLDANGEISGNITAPSNPGEYTLELRIVNSSITQQIRRWFRIDGIKAKMSLNKKKLFVGEDVIVTVNVTDTAGQPVENADVHLNVFSMMKGPKDDNESEGYQSDTIYIPSNCTNTSGIAVFNISSFINGTLNSSDYMVFGDAQKMDYGWSSFESPFMVRTLNTTLTLSGSEFYPGETIHVNLVSFNQSINPAEGLNVTVALEAMQMKSDGDDEGEGEEGEEDFLAYCNGLINSTGQFNCSLDIPDWENITGPAIVFVDLEGYLDGEEVMESEETVVIIHNPVSNLSITMSSGPYQGGQMIDAWVKGNESNISLSVAQFMKHMKKAEGAIPMFEIMGGSPESGNEDYYDNPLLFNASAEVHFRTLARSNPGNYTILVPFFDKESTSMMNEEPLDVLFVDYWVE